MVTSMVDGERCACGKASPDFSRKGIHLRTTGRRECGGMFSRARRTVLLGMVGELEAQVGMRNVVAGGKRQDRNLGC